jgi:hypothetical protein
MLRVGWVLEGRDSYSKRGVMSTPPRRARIQAMALKPNRKPRLDSRGFHEFGI